MPPKKESGAQIAKELDQLRQKMSALEQKQATIDEQERRKRKMEDITMIRNEDLGDKIATNVKGRVTVRALARAFEKAGRDPASAKHSEFVEQLRAKGRLAEGAEAERIDKEGVEVDLEEMDLDLDEDVDLELEGEDEGAMEEEMELELDLDDLEEGADEGAQQGDEEEEVDLDADLEIEDEEQDAEGGEGGELEIEMEEEIQAQEQEEAHQKGKKQAPQATPSKGETAKMEDIPREEAPVGAHAAQEIEVQPRRKRAETISVVKYETQAQILPPSSTTSTLIVPSHAVINNRFLNEPFRVVKIDEGAFLGGKKERIWNIDMLGGRFLNLDMMGSLSFALKSHDLYRVERHPSDPKRLTLHFFDAPHPYDLQFMNAERRQKFYEISMLLRRNSIVWAPGLCADKDNDTMIKVQGTTIVRPNGKVVKVKGEANFRVARMPYEVIDFWYGCFSLQKRSLPETSQALASFIPKGVSEVYVIGITDVPASLIGNRALGEFFCTYLGSTQYYVLAQSATESKEHKYGNNAIVVVVKRSFIVRMSQIQAVELVPVKRNDSAKGDFTAVGTTFRINEASIAVILINTNPLVTDPVVRSSNIRALMSQFPFGDESVDIGVRFDYLIVSGAFGFADPFGEHDGLVAQMKGGNILSDFCEGDPSPHLARETHPMRIVYFAKPRTCRLDIKQYTTSPSLNLPNACISSDMFCQRPFMYTFCEQVPPCQFSLGNVTLEGQRIPHIVQAELRISGEWFNESPIIIPLLKKGESYCLTKAIPSIQPTIPAFDYLRLQTIYFSMHGLLPSAAATPPGGKKLVIASASLPLKNTFSLGENVSFSLTLYYRGCTVGMLHGDILQTLVQSTQPLVGMPPAPQERDAVVVSCDENQAIDEEGTWSPALFSQHGAYDWSAPNAPNVKSHRESIVLPDETKWKWLTDWRHESRTDYRDGWRYSTSFKDPFVLKKSKEHRVRTRRWTRIMQGEDALVVHRYLEQNRK